MKEWMVTVGGTTVTPADPDQVLEQLAEHSPAIAIDGRQLSSTMTFSAVSATSALEQAVEAIRSVGPLEVDHLEVMSSERQLAELERPNLPDLVGVTEVAEMLGVSKQRVWELQKTHETFPPVAVDLKAGPVWLRTSVEAWKEAWPRRTGRPRIEREPDPAVEPLKISGGGLKLTNPTIADPRRK